MPCESYKNALIEAASGLEAQSELRAHLDACASCRETLAQERSLFAAIDGGLHQRANVGAPPSLLPRVRARLDEVAVAPRLQWLQPLVLPSAGVGLVLLIFVMTRPHHPTPENVARQGPVVVPAPVTSGATTNPREISPAVPHTAAGTPLHSVRRSTSSRSAASSNPQVLVPPDEREAFARFIAALNARNNVAAALLAQPQEKRGALASLNPLQIADIEIKPLEQNESPDSASEKL